jgi:hypothetical protein
MSLPSMDSMLAADATDFLTLTFPLPSTRMLKREPSEKNEGSS